MTIENARSVPLVVPFAFLFDQFLRWKRGERVPVEDYLRSCPALHDHPGALLDLIYHEFVLREERGEDVRTEEYLARFPALSEAIVAQLSAHEVWSALDASS